MVMPLTFTVRDINGSCGVTNLAQSRRIENFTPCFENFKQKFSIFKKINKFYAWTSWEIWCIEGKTYINNWPVSISFRIFLNLKYFVVQFGYYQYLHFLIRSVWIESVQWIVFFLHVTRISVPYFNFYRVDVFIY